MKNIKAGFWKTGLVPFDPRKALERLPTLSTSAISTLVASAPQIQTPKTQKDVQQVPEDLSTTAQEATKKIGKAANDFPC